MTRTSIAFAFIVLLVLLATSPAMPDGDDPPRKVPDRTAALTGQAGFEKARGDARYRNRPDQRELEIDLDKVPLPTGTVLNVEVNGMRVGTMKVGLLRGASLKLRSKDGDTIPFIANGTIVTVRTEQRQAVVSGRF